MICAVAVLALATQQASAAQINSSLTATGAVTLTLAANPGTPDNTAVIQVSGTFTGVTATIQGSADGTSWNNLAALRMDTNVSEQTPTVSDATVRMWKVDVTNLQKVRFNVTAISTNTITVQINSNFYPLTPLTGTSTQGQAIITASASGGAQANNASLAAAAGKTTYITGFQISGAGATAASAITVTVTGIATTMNYTVVVPAGVTTAITTLNVTFPQPIPASATNTAIVVNVPSFGSGNTNATVSVQGFQQ
jgi:hypothetical protein